MSSGTTIQVWLYERLVGTLARNRHGLVTFTPDAGWLDADQVPRLGLGLLRPNSATLQRGERVSGTGLPQWFENVLPEVGSALRGRVCKAHGVRENDSLGLLVRLGMDLPGAVRVRACQPVPDPEREFEPGEEAGDAARLRYRFSLAGFQLKFSMRATGRRFTLPGKDESGEWIVKVPDPEHLTLPAVEHLTMRWASGAGFDVPETRVVPVADLENLGELPVPRDAMALAVRRFDRLANGERVHHEDLLQVLEWSPAQKYGDDPGHRIGFDQVGRLLLDDAGVEVAQEFVRRLAFTIASGNGDAHLKNWSLLWPNAARQPKLTPCYDQVAMVALPGWDWDATTPTLALGFGRRNSLVDLDGARVATFASRARIPNAADLFWVSLECARDAFRAMRDDWTAAQQEALRMHWQRVPVLRRLGPL